MQKILGLLVVLGCVFGGYFEVVGFGTMDKMEKEMSYFHFNADGLKYFYNGLKNKISNNKDYKNFETDFSLLYNGKKYPVQINPGLAPLRHSLPIQMRT